MMSKLLLAMLCCCFFSSVAWAQNDMDMEKERNSLKRKDFILDKAAEDIADNITLWVELRSEFDAGAATGWIVSLGDKIPSQPVAVIEVLSFLDEGDVGYICPRLFLEGSEHYEMEQWMNRAITSLDSFTMKDPKKEKIRAKCLENIRQALSEKEKWQ